MADSTQRAGQLLGNYRILRLVGQGGFADVYLGEHIHLNTLAAIKVLHTRLVEDNIENFRSEARTVAHLIHPNIVRVHDFGVEGTVPFLVMDFAPNGTLRQRHPRGTQVPIEVIVPYVKQIAAALQYAHNQKFIHRDIKPENILLGGNNEVLLSDFGIAVVTQSMRIQLANQGTSDTAGTVSYMAPEQIRGATVPASDQYALAVVIYEWLTGALPFRGTYMEVVAQQINATPPPPHEKVPTIAPDVERVILTALAKEPQNRFVRIESFANALEQAAQPRSSGPLAKALDAPPLPKNSIQTPAMEASLKGPAGRTALGSTRLIIGRTPDNGLVVNDVKASSHHAEISLEGSSYKIADLGSTNGTFVNEQRLSPGAPRLLQAGDAIRIGDTTFAFEVKSLARPGQYASDGSTVREVPPTLDVATNFGDFNAAMQPNYGEALAAQNPSNPPPVSPQYTPYTPLPPLQPQYTPMPAPPFYAQPQYTSPQQPLSLPAAPSQPPLSPTIPRPQPRQQPRSMTRTVILAAVTLIVILGALGGFFIIHNNQVAQQQAIANANATGTAIAHANATGTAIARVNATGTAVANATASAIANANATATAIATSQYPPFTILALDDSLTSSNNSGGWNTGTECQFMATGYQVSIAQAGFFWYCLATATNYSDFAYQVTMTIVKGNCGGLIFRALDTKNFYTFDVCQNGLYDLGLYAKSGNKSTNVTTSSAIHTGLNQVNTLAVVVQGTSINLYVNGQRIDTVTDSTITHGEIGVIATDATSPTVVDYTNALVWTAS